MKVMMITSGYGPPWNEGVKNMVRTLEEQLRERDVEVLICARDESDADNFEHPLRQGVGTFYRKTIAFWWKAARRARKEKVQVIHLHSNLSPLLGLKCFVIRSVSRVPLLLHVAGLGNTIFGYRLLLSTDGIIVGGEYLKEYLPNGIDFPPVSPHQNVQVSEQTRLPDPNGVHNKILYLGALEPARGVLTLVDAAAILKENLALEDFTVTIAWNGWGESSYVKQVKDRINSHGINQHFLWEETVEDPGVLYREHDLVVIPRASKARMGFPLRLVESMSYGKPVVVSDLGEMPKVARECGIIVKHNDALGFASAIHQLLTDSELYRRCSENSFQQSAQYTPHQSVARLIDLYRELAGVG